MAYKNKKGKFNIVCKLLKHDFKRSGLVNSNGVILLRYVCPRCGEIELRK